MRTVKSILLFFLFFTAALLLFSCSSNSPLFEEHVLSESKIPATIRYTKSGDLLTLNWAAVQNASGYNVYQSRTDLALNTQATSFTKLNDTPITTSNYTYAFTQPGTYSFGVRAVFSDESEGGLSRVVSVDVPSIARALPPTNLSYTGVNLPLLTITLQWTASTTAGTLGYNIYRASASSPTVFVKLNKGIISNTKLSYEDRASLSYSSHYIYVIRSVGATGEEGDSSASLPVETPPPPSPTAPNAIAYDITANPLSISFVWESSPTSFTRGYNVYRALSGTSDYVRLNTTLILTNSFTDTTASFDTAYDYVVRTVGSVSEESENSAVLTLTTPAEN